MGGWDERGGWTTTTSTTTTVPSIHRGHCKVGGFVPGRDQFIFRGRSLSISTTTQRAAECMELRRRVVNEKPSTRKATAAEAEAEAPSPSSFSNTTTIGKMEIWRDNDLLVMHWLMMYLAGGRHWWWPMTLCQISFIYCLWRQSFHSSLGDILPHPPSPLPSHASAVARSVVGEREREREWKVANNNKYNNLQWIRTLCG